MARASPIVLVKRLVEEGHREALPKDVVVSASRARVFLSGFPEVCDEEPAAVLDEEYRSLELFPDVLAELWDVFW